ncbi:MAG TPA: FHA domain-containing protein, partial [Myxococcaceae bacterium]|nr:FHA domain-containing protein [Myxococcaceae bacterium]
MGFQLTIAEGREAGKEFVFDQDSVLIGRVSECDVVLYDNGVSRRHCRIFAQGGGYAVEDLGSSNGTLVNGLKVTKQVLADGDRIALGPVLFTFQDVGGVEEQLDGAGDANSTRIVSLDSVQRQRTRNRGAALAPEGADEEELAEVRRVSTRAMPAVRPRTGRTGPQPAALERAAPSAAAPPRRPAPSAVAHAAPAEQGGRLSAA